MNRTRPAVPVMLAALALAFALAGPAVAAPKPSPSPSAAPAPSPTATPEPLDIQINRLKAEVDSNPNDKDAMTQLATDYLQVNRPDLAAELTQKLLQGGTKNAQVYFTDGAAQAALGHLPEGIASMEQAADLEPTNPIVLQSLTQMYLRANRIADAERVAKRAVAFNTTDAAPGGQKPDPAVQIAAYENLGFVYGSEKKWDDARTQFEAAAAVDPKDAHPIVLIARTYQEQNANALAMQSLDRALTVDPNDIEALIGKAELAGTTHDVTTAIATYTKIYALQPDDVDKAAVLDEEAKLYAVEKQDAQADAAFRDAIAKFPNIDGTHIVYGDYLASKNDRSGAQREWTAGLGANKDNPDALARLGNLAAANNDFTTAVSYFKKLTEVAAQDPRAYLLLGQAYLAQHNFSAARDAFRASYNLAKTPDSLVGLATADQGVHNWNEAIQIYEAIDKGAPDLVKQNPVLLYDLGQAYQSTGQKDKAKATYQRFLTYLKPGTQGYNDVKGLIASLDRPAGGASKPAAKPAPSPSPASHH